MKRVELLGIIHTAAEESLSSCDAGENPLIAWTGFIDRLDAIGRRSIGDKLETDGRNRYTGREETV
jgi:hypothetical protein